MAQFKFFALLVLMLGTPAVLAAPFAIPNAPLDASSTAVQPSDSAASPTSVDTNETSSTTSTLAPIPSGCIRCQTAFLRVADDEEDDEDLKLLRRSCILCTSAAQA